MSAPETKDISTDHRRLRRHGRHLDRLAKRGHDLILVARNRSRLAALARRLKDETRRSVETIAADLNDKSDLARIETTLRENARGVR